MLRGKNRLSYDLHLLLFEAYLREYCGFFCVTHLTQGLLTFLAASSMARLAGQSVMQITDYITLCSQKLFGMQ
jgi:hypothetical protein